MKAQRLHEFGSAEHYRLEEIETPEPGPGEVLVRVKAASLNPVDSRIMDGGVPFASPLPTSLGADVAGIMEAAGAGVEAFAPGDQVYGCAGGMGGRPGSFADYMVCDADLIAKMPDGYSFEEAAALPLVAITAWEALVERAEVGHGDMVLIHAGTGGVGHVAVQIAKALGAEVFTTVSTEAKAETAARLGADHVINYRQTSVADYVAQYTDGAGFDVVFDTVGGDNLDRSFEAAKPEGQVVTIVALDRHDLTPMHLKGLTLHVVFMVMPMIGLTDTGRRRRLMADLTRFVETHNIKPLIDPHRFSLSDVPDAHRLLDAGGAVGKIVISVD